MNFFIVYRQYVENFLSINTIGQKENDVSMRMVNQLQSNEVRDYVLPIAISKPNDDGTFTFVKLLGTAFLLSNNQAMTSGHVLREVNHEDVQALFIDRVNGGWVGFSIENIELHPRADAARFTLKCNITLETIFQISQKQIHAASPIKSFGYPNDCLYEIPAGQNQKILPRPDMVYFQGYVKRRISFNPGFPHIPGEGFYEINEWFQPGCSGSPVFGPKVGKCLWEVIGIYVGDWQVNEGPRLGYVLRTDQIQEWICGNE